MCALLACRQDDQESIIKYISECNRLDIPILPPDIKESDTEFKIVDKSKIRFGLEAIKNLGSPTIKHILSVRKKLGKFATLHDFIQGINKTLVNRKKLLSLVMSGALDSFSYSRAGVAKWIEDYLTWEENQEKYEASKIKYEAKLILVRAREEAGVVPLTSVGVQQEATGCDESKPREGKDQT